MRMGYRGIMVGLILLFMTKSEGKIVSHLFSNQIDRAVFTPSPSTSGSISCWDTWGSKASPTKVKPVSFKKIKWSIESALILQKMFYRIEPRSVWKQKVFTSFIKRSIVDPIGWEKFCWNNLQLLHFLPLEVKQSHDNCFFPLAGWKKCLMSCETSGVNFFRVYDPDFL